MPGILGIIRPDLNGQDGLATLQNMMQSLRHYPWYHETPEPFPGAALGVMSLRHAASVAKHGERYVLFFDGELYNQAELRQELNSTVKNTAALALQAILRWNEQAFTKFNGIFQLALWDARQDELLLAGDRGGLRPIYFAHRGEAFAFAPEVKALLETPIVAREIDWQGLASFVQYGFVTGDRTFWRDIKVLPGGSLARFRRGRLQISRYWRMHYQDRVRFDQRELEETFLATWQDVMQRQAGERANFGTLLSGGLDSRLIQAALTAQDRKAPTFTFGKPGETETELAQQVAAASRSAHHLTVVDADNIANDLARAVYLTDGLYNCMHTNTRHLLPDLTANVEVIFDGISPLDCHYRRCEIPLRRLLSRNQPERWLRHSYTDEIIADLRAMRLSPGLSIDLMSERFHRSEPPVDYLQTFAQAATKNGQGAFAILDQFEFEEYTPRFSMFGPFLLRQVAEVRLPFFDKKILELTAQLPPELRGKDKFLHKYAIQKLAPALAKIPYERTGLPLTAGSVQTHWSLVKKFFQRRFASRSVQTGASLSNHNRLLRAVPSLKTLAHSLLVARWEDGSRLFNRRSLETLLAHHFTGQGNHAEFIGRLLTVEMWHQLFMESPRQSQDRPQFPRFTSPTAFAPAQRSEDEALLKI